ncbi:MAG: hypothetical protein J4415_01070 [Candidatus Diapherotrites archaeon]|uniref:Uncharacterized protein n=1 Tax=Candidatus Iainarchaeum sp. TaxID=3101447 RepID=A0A8T4KWD3_9ARCH|nr:hypothetical protein [Candidatus Diapherotrites archaeon]
MQEDSARIVNAIKRLDKALNKANLALGKNAELNAMLKEIYELASEIEQISETNPSVSNSLQKALEERCIVDLYVKFENALNELKSTAKSYEEQAIKASLFLENYRNARTYNFADENASRDFVSSLYELFGIETAYLKPEMVGLSDFTAIAKELKLQEEGANTIKVPITQVPALIGKLQKSALAKNFRLENELVKIVFKQPNVLFVEADSSKIKRLDRLCKTLGGSY